MNVYYRKIVSCMGLLFKSSYGIIYRGKHLCVLMRRSKKKKEKATKRCLRAYQKLVLSLGKVIYTSIMLFFSLLLFDYFHCCFCWKIIFNPKPTFSFATKLTYKPSKSLLSNIWYPFSFMRNFPKNQSKFSSSFGHNLKSLRV